MGSSAPLKSITSSCANVEISLRNINWKKKTAEWIVKIHVVYTLKEVYKYVHIWGYVIMIIFGKRDAGKEGYSLFILNLSMLFCSF